MTSLKKSCLREHAVDEQRCEDGGEDPMTCVRDVSAVPSPLWLVEFLVQIVHCDVKQSLEMTSLALAVSRIVMFSPLSISLSLSL